MAHQFDVVFCLYSSSGIYSSQIIKYSSHGILG